MDVREKPAELSDIQVLQREIECVKRKSYTNCTDCFNCDLLMTDERILTAYKNAIDALQNEHGVTVQEWISVKDMLPDDEQEVLVIAHGWGGRLVYVGSHKRVEAQKSWLTGITNKSSEWLLWGWSYLREPMVTHWMPILQPPKGE